MSGNRITVGNPYTLRYKGYNISNFLFPTDIK